MESFRKDSDSSRSLSLYRMTSSRSVASTEGGFIDGLGDRTYSTIALRVSPPNGRRVSIPVAPPSPLSADLDGPSTPKNLLLTPCITRTPSVLDHPSVLSSQNGNLRGYMSELKRSASKAIVRRRVSVVEPVATLSEVERLTSELTAREEELMNACDMGQSLVGELEAAREELLTVQDNEVKLLEAIEAMQSENSKLNMSRQEAQREINALRVVTDKAAEEIATLRDTLRKTGSMQRRREEEEMVTRMENEQWLLKNALLQRGETEVEVTLREEKEKRMALMHESEAGLVDLAARCLKDGSAVFLKLQKRAVRQETAMTERCALLKTRVEAMEESAEDRNNQLQELQERLVTSGKTKKGVLGPRKDSCTPFVSRASELVSKIREACREYDDRCA